MSDINNINGDIQSIDKNSTLQTLSFDDVPSSTPDTQSIRPIRSIKRKSKYNNKSTHRKIQLNNVINNEIQSKQEQYTQRDYNQSIITQSDNNDPRPFSNNKLKLIKNRKLRHKLTTDKHSNTNSIHSAAAHDTLLLPTSTGTIDITNNDTIKSFQLKQSDINELVDTRTVNKQYEFHNLDYGSYITKYSRNGRYLLSAGEQGHISLFDTHDYTLKCEYHVNERINDICVLHNETMYAVAQAQYTYIYDNTGIELHCLTNHTLVNQLQYLPYHFILASIGQTGYLKYQDISTGQFITELRTRKGEVKTMCQNKQNAILHLGHHNGQVTLWSPNSTTPLANIYCHRGQVNCVDVTSDGHYMCSSGIDGQIKIWDLRTYKQLHSYFTTRPTRCMSISDNSMLSLGYSSSVAVWNNPFQQDKLQSPYLYQQYPGQPIHVCIYCVPH